MQRKPAAKKRKRGHYIPEWMNHRGMKPADLIGATGADKSVVSRWLSIARNEPVPEYQAQIAALFGVTAPELFTPPPRELVYTAEDPAAPEPIDPDRHSTIGSITGVQGIPADASAQIDVTAGMGGGGLTIVAEGVPGRSGMTFAAEHISDYWRLPAAILSSMGGVKPHDVTFVPVQGDSMLPTLVEGDVVVVDTRHRWPSPDGIYALNDAFGGVIVKRLIVTSKPSEDEQLVDVISDNPRHPPKSWRVADLHIVGRVVRKFGALQ